jgi:hypothetical protein
MNVFNDKIDEEINVFININKDIEKKEKIIFENIENIMKLHKKKNKFFLDTHDFFINNFDISEELKIFLNINNNNKHNLSEIYDMFFEFLIENEISIKKNIIIYDQKIEKLFNLKKKDILTFNNLNIHLQKHFL